MKNDSLIGTMLALACWIGACGGGGSSGSDDTTTEAGDQLQDVATLEGQWVSGVCTARSDNLTSVAGVYVISKTSASGIAWNSGSMTYSTKDCSGTGVLSELTSNLGSVEFTSTQSLGAHQYYRGTYTPSNGSTKPMIWALPTAQKLCVLTDSEPTVFPTAQSVKDYVDVLAASTCYYKKV